MEFRLPPAVLQASRTQLFPPTFQPFKSRRARSDAPYPRYLPVSRARLPPSLRLPRHTQIQLAVQLPIPKLNTTKVGRVAPSRAALQPSVTRLRTTKSPFYSNGPYGSAEDLLF